MKRISPDTDGQISPSPPLPRGASLRLLGEWTVCRFGGRLRQDLSWEVGRREARESRGRRQVGQRCRSGGQKCRRVRMLGLGSLKRTLAQRPA